MRTMVGFIMKLGNWDFVVGNEGVLEIVSGCGDLL